MKGPAMFTPTGRGIEADQLIDLGVHIDAGTAELDELIERRNALIVKLIADGLNLAQVAQLAGLSRQRVHQLTHKATEEALT